MIPIPDFLKHLPIYRGYPVPYFVPKDENGVYQLKYASHNVEGKYEYINGELKSVTD